MTATVARIVSCGDTGMWYVTGILFPVGGYMTCRLRVVQTVSAGRMYFSRAWGGKDVEGGGLASSPAGRYGGGSVAVFFGENPVWVYDTASVCLPRKPCILFCPAESGSCPRGCVSEKVYRTGVVMSLNISGMGRR